MRKWIVAALGTAVLLAIKVYIPIGPRTGKSLLFFEDIAAQDYASFEARAKAMHSAAIERQLLDQVHRVSRIASFKMKWVRRAMWSSVVSSAFWLVLMAWGSLQ